MRAYRKTATRHPYCVYLTAAERYALVKEMQDRRVTFPGAPALFKLLSHLTNPRES